MRMLMFCLEDWGPGPLCPLGYAIVNHYYEVVYWLLNNMEIIDLG